MKGRQQEGIPSEPTSTQQSSSNAGVSASGELATSISGERQPLRTTSKSQKQGVQKPICRYFMSSSCKYGDHCKFYHPKAPSKSRPVNKSEVYSNEKGSVSNRHTPTDLNLGMFMKPAKLRAPVARPEPVKCKTPADLLQVSVVYMCMIVWIDSSYVQLSRVQGSGVHYL